MPPIAPEDSSVKETITTVILLREAGATLSSATTMYCPMDTTPFTNPAWSEFGNFYVQIADHKKA